MNVLTEIVEATRKGLEARKRRVPLERLEISGRGRTPRGDSFAAAVRRAGRINIIAECKRRSPSRGVLRASYTPAALAREYEQAGAAAISVLTEQEFFGGALAHLVQARGATRLPLLCKDFIVDEYQLLEARAAGADAVLLIAAALEGVSLARLLAGARANGLEALVEVHDEEDLARAMEAGAAIIGVNNRNLKTLHVDLATAERLIRLIPNGAAAVAESGIRSSDDLLRLLDCGYLAFLIGEQFMRAGQPGAALAALIETAGRKRQCS